MSRDEGYIVVCPEPGKGLSRGSMVIPPGVARLPRARLGARPWRPPGRDHRPNKEEADRQTRSLAAVAVLLALALAALFLIAHLRREGEIEDCLMAQRLSCDKLLDAP